MLAVGMDFFFLIYRNGVHAKVEGEGWGMCSGHRNMMTWPGPQLLSWKKGMIRKSWAGAEWKKEEGDW